MNSYSFLRFILNFQLPNEIRCSQSKLKSSEIIKCQLMTSYMYDPNNNNYYNNNYCYQCH